MLFTTVVAMLAAAHKPILENRFIFEYLALSVVYVGCFIAATVPITWLGNRILRIRQDRVST